MKYDLIRVSYAYNRAESQRNLRRLPLLITHLKMCSCSCSCSLCVHSLGATFNLRRFLLFVASENTIGEKIVEVQYQDDVVAPWDHHHSIPLQFFFRNLYLVFKIANF